MLTVKRQPPVGNPIPRIVGIKGASLSAQAKMAQVKIKVSDAPCQSGLILGLRPTNERRRYKVTPSLIGWAQT